MWSTHKSYHLYFREYILQTGHKFTRNVNIAGNIQGFLEVKRDKKKSLQFTLFIVRSHPGGCRNMFSYMQIQMYVLLLLMININSMDTMVKTTKDTMYHSLFSVYVGSKVSLYLIV